MGKMSQVKQTSPKVICCNFFRSFITFTFESNVCEKQKQKQKKKQKNEDGKNGEKSV